MKARLLIGVLLCVAILAAIGGVARADKVDSPDCNASNSGKYANALVPTFVPDSIWKDVSMKWTQKCGSSSESVEVELQRSTDGGATWSDTTDKDLNRLDFAFATDAAHAGVIWSRTHVETISCNHSALYRDVAWISGSTPDISNITGC